jgi:hypothetical protein
MRFTVTCPNNDTYVTLGRPSTVCVSQLSAHPIETGSGRTHAVHGTSVPRHVIGTELSELIANRAGLGAANKGGIVVIGRRELSGTGLGVTPVPGSLTGLSGGALDFNGDITDAVPVVVIAIARGTVLAFVTGLSQSLPTRHTHLMDADLRGTHGINGTRCPTGVPLAPISKLVADGPLVGTTLGCGVGLVGGPKTSGTLFGLATKEIKSKTVFAHGKGGPANLRVAVARCPRGAHVGCRVVGYAATPSRNPRAIGPSILQG